MEKIEGRNIKLRKVNGSPSEAFLGLMLCIFRPEAGSSSRDRGKSAGSLLTPQCTRMSTVL